MNSWDKKFFSILLSSITSGVHTASYLIGKGNTLSPGVKQPGREADR
jgi:hypothetical protein